MGLDQMGSRPTRPTSRLIKNKGPSNDFALYDVTLVRKKAYERESLIPIHKEKEYARKEIGQGSIGT